MAGNDEGDAHDAGDATDANSTNARADRATNARYLYLKRRLPGESYEAFLKRLTDEFVGKERSRRGDDCGRE